MCVQAPAQSPELAYVLRILCLDQCPATFATLSGSTPDGLHYAVTVLVLSMQCVAQAYEQLIRRLFMYLFMCLLLVQMRRRLCYGGCNHSPMSRELISVAYAPNIALRQLIEAWTEACPSLAAQESVHVCAHTASIQ